MEKINYRSAGLAKGFFSEVGNMHLHIDSPPENQDLVLEIVKELVQRGHPGKLNFVEEFIAGPQRLEYPLEYGSHTPEIEGEESLDFFSTNYLMNGLDAITVINTIYEKIKNTKGVVIEVEQQIGKLDEAGLVWLPEWRCYMNNLAEKVDLEPSPSLLYEIHHAFNIPENWPRVTLTRLLDFCNDNSVAIGGWFVFIENGIIKYRSNSFSNASTLDLQAQIKKEHEALELFLKNEKLECSVRTVCEKILMVGHTS